MSKRGDAPPASGKTAGDMLPSVCAALAIYLVLFYLSPIGRDVPQAEGSLRRVHVLVSLFLGDEIVASWVEGCSWKSLAERGQILAASAAIFGVACLAGWTVLRLLRLSRSLTQLERFVFASGIGLSLISSTMLALGLFGFLRAEALAAAALTVVAVAGIVQWRQRPSAGDANELIHPTGPADGDGLHLSLHWLWLMVPFVVVLFLGAMLPPVEFDVREYHLQAPKEFYQAGRITFLPHNVYANMPLGAEMLSLAGMTLCGDWQSGALVGKTLIACFAPLGALALLAAGIRFASATAGMVAALVYISIPWIALVSMQGLIDGAVAFYLFAALNAVILWQRRRTAGDPAYAWLGIAGFLSGSAVACKYPSVVFSVVPLAAWIVWLSLETLVAERTTQTIRARLTATIAPTTVFLLGCALACGPWLAKNAVLTGNPVYPLLYDWFDGATRTIAKNDQWVRAHSPSNYDPADLARHLAGIMLTSDWLSPLVMPLAALSLVSWRRNMLVRGLALYFVYVLATWWLFTHRIDRFWVPVLPVAAMLAGIGATWTAARGWRIVLSGLLAFGLIANFGVITNGVMGDNRFLAELDLLRHDSRLVDPWHVYLNEHADEVTRVLLVGDAQAFDLEVPVLYNTVFDDCIFEQLVRDKTDRQARMALAERDISHIFVGWGEVARYRLPGNYGFTKFVARNVFDDLVESGLLQEVPPLKNNPGQLFRVVPPKATTH
jgi:hypothetical protein